MEEKLINLRNTLMLVEVKGESAKIMADCLRYLEKEIEEERNKPSEQPNVAQ